MNTTDREHLVGTRKEANTRDTCSSMSRGRKQATQGLSLKVAPAKQVSAMIVYDVPGERGHETCFIRIKPGLVTDSPKA